jgi:hypothetical protein
MSCDYLYCCDILIDCAKCGKIEWEVKPTYQYSTYNLDGSFKSGKTLDVTYPVLEKMLAKNGWKRLLNGGYVCKDCYENSKPSKKDISKELGFIK